MTGWQDGKLTCRPPTHCESHFTAKIIKQPKKRARFGLTAICERFSGPLLLVYLVGVGPEGRRGSTLSVSSARRGDPGTKRRQLFFFFFFSFYGALHFDLHSHFLSGEDVTKSAGPARCVCVCMCMCLFVCLHVVGSFGLFCMWPVDARSKSNREGRTTWSDGQLPWRRTGMW
ncbi:hypothetical protein LZ32DRAFT_70242 [Colletotrichum eremochloae]|nr:hypothetical protein LZ32DRAFT_70242 [Colletotrichum eremochloae]